MSRNRFVIPNGRVKVLTSNGEKVIKFCHSRNKMRYAMEEADWAVNDLWDSSVNPNSSMVGTDSIWHRYSDISVELENLKDFFKKNRKYK